MESICFLEKIKSFYTFENIFSFIKGKNFKYKLVNYSKKIQGLLRLNKEKFIERFIE